ncbi:Uu.00g001140.m01.CDS01 [Anthostomella pinea]|uniref:Uu.00g001140.m01.CDS01 n=1 Tax=Anthostomella pinea TaxID=933095 RepID=A0AAI8YIG9_9PEZI|nr:Uu.00g001140.m01.CDS01 [Anthostomella pinea]
MAPITRRRAKAKETEAASPTMSDTPTSTEITVEVPILPRGKRKSLTSNVEDAQNVAVPQSDSPKRQKLAVRTREDEITKSGWSTHIEVQIPSSSAPRPRSSAVADSQEEDDEDDDESEEKEEHQEGEPEAVKPTNASKQLEGRPEAVEPTSASQQLASQQLEKEASQQLARQSVEPEPTPQPKPMSKHVVFGDDDDVEKFVAAAATETKKDAEETKEESDGEKSDDDEAPEAVSTQATAKQTLESAKAVSEAADKQVASLKRKRQERDNLLKQQAQKRKRTRKPVKTTHDGSNGEEVTNKGRQRSGKGKLPDMLPAEFLTDSSSDSEDETALKKFVKKPKKINFETALQTIGNEGKRPRDEIVGTTRYRVLAEQADKSLAPKMNKNSLKSKQALLKRNRVGIMPNKKKGFFVGKKQV